MQRKKKTPVRKRTASSPVSLLIGTRKGGFILRSDPARRSWKLSGPIFLGHVVNHFVADPRDRKTFLIASRTGHLGPTIFRSEDRGRTWEEAKRPPAFLKSETGEKGRIVDHTFHLAHGSAEEKGVWYAGTSPPGLFRSEDGGKTWEGVSGFNDHLMRSSWTGPDEDGIPDGPILHSIQIDPRDPNHLYIGLSIGGVFESRDGGSDWSPLNRGVQADFLPDPDAEYGHDPHCVKLHPLRPDLLYQQNHCGIYRIERPGKTWVRIGRNMPKKVGDIGFPIVLHPRDPQTAWVFPMDGTTVWPRTSPGGRPAAYVTRDGGGRWKRQDRGLPPARAWWTVKRQAMTSDGREPLGLYFGTTSGEVWGSRDEGEGWKNLAAHLPEIYSIDVF
jgi:photosystem II stability/assembly factor-like uncharacterized protein